MIPHPSSLLQEDWIAIIRNNAAAAEQDKRLQPEQLQLIYDQQWFKILVPAAYYGKELSLPEAVKLEEAIAWADGSMGWLVTLCAGAGWFGGFMQPSLAKLIFSDPAACLAGSGAATGIAEKDNGRYKIHGRWLHASGAPDATVFTANCLIKENGASLTDAAGKPLIQSFAFLRDEVTVIPTWHSMGMVATASNAYEATGISVPADRTFILNSDHALINTPLYHYPFLQLAEVTLVANISGIAINFIDLARELFFNKKGRNAKPLIENAAIAATLDTIEKRIATARAAMYQSLSSSWQLCAEENNIAPAVLSEVSLTARALALAARESVDLLFPYCGLTAADTRTEINRVWRDMHTASQHSLLVFDGD